MFDNTKILTPNVQQTTALGRKERLVESAGLLKALALDAWYKAFVYVGVVLLAVGLTVDVRGVTNGELLLIAAGVFFIGIGEWKNHKTLAWIKPPNIYTGGAALMQTKVRQPDAFGIIIDMVGCIMLVLGAWYIIGRAWLGAGA